MIVIFTIPNFKYFFPKKLVTIHHAILKAESKNIGQQTSLNMVGIKYEQDHIGITLSLSSVTWNY